MGICSMTQETQTGALWQAEGWGREGDGREVWEGGNMDVPMADSCWCMTEKPQNSVKQLSFNLKKNFNMLLYNKKNTIK